MLTLDDTAERLKLSRNTVVKMIRNGSLKALRIGDQYRIPEENYDKFLSLCEIVPSH